MVHVSEAYVITDPIKVKYIYIFVIFFGNFYLKTFVFALCAPGNSGDNLLTAKPRPTTVHVRSNVTQLS